MTEISTVLSWLQANWQNIVAIYLGLVGVASIIVKLTPTLKDDSVLLAIIKFVAKNVALARTVDDNAVRASLPTDGPTPTDPPYQGTE